MNNDGGYSSSFDTMFRLFIGFVSFCIGFVSFCIVLGMIVTLVAGVHLFNLLHKL